MKKPETIFAEKVDRDLEEFFGHDIWFENIQQTGKIGTPDRLVCLRGAFIALEIKTDEGTASHAQLMKLLRIRRAGGHCALVSPSNWQSIFGELKKVFLNLK